MARPLAEVLDRVQGRVEWSVKTYARGGAEVEPSAPATPVEGKGAGVAYLQRKRESTQRRMQSEERAHQVAEEIHAALAEHSVASRRLAAQDPRLTGHEGVMTLNGAYLVPVEESDAFAATLSALSEQHPEALSRGRRAVAAVLLRGAGPDVTELAAQASTEVQAGPQIALVDLLDRLLGTGVVLAGDVVISLAGVDLVQVRLHALITTVRAEMRAAGMVGAS